jgi:hypothetical protein
MKIARLVLVLSALPFAAIGLAFLVRPVAMASLVGVTLEGSAADNDVRAVYGGLQLGCAAFLAACAYVPGWLRPGLAAQLMTFGGLALARIVSWVAVGLPEGLGLLLHLGEVVGLAAGVWAWRSLAVELRMRPIAESPRAESG